MYRMLWAPAALLCLASLVVGDSHIFSVTGDGQTAKSSELSISGGSFYAQKRSPAVIFGTVQLPVGKREFTYVVLSKLEAHRLGIPKITCMVNVDGTEATDKSTIEFKGKKITLAYKARITRGAITSEDLTVDGKKMDLHEGQVFLVDFTKDEVTWSQVKAGLPEHPGDSGKPDSVESTATKLLGQLREDNASVREFLK